MFGFSAIPSAFQSASALPQALSSSPPEVRVLMPMAGPLRLRGRILTIELPPGRALTLRVQRADLLRLQGSRVWLTLTTRGEAGPGTGDHFLNNGESWAVAPGQTWVAEPFAKAGALAAAARLDWQPAPSWNEHWATVRDRMLRRGSRGLPNQAAWDERSCAS